MGALPRYYRLQDVTPEFNAQRAEEFAKRQEQEMEMRRRFRGSSSNSEGKSLFDIIVSGTPEELAELDKLDLSMLDRLKDRDRGDDESEYGDDVPTL